MVYAIFLTLHILIAFLLMVVVLLQSGRGGSLSASFGGGGNQTLFGGRGATSFLTKATWILGAGFMVTSLMLAVTIGRRTGTAEPRSLLKENPIEIPAGAPGASSPAEPAPQTPSQPVPGGN